MEKLFNQLTEYCKSEIYPFHMPGHKRMEENNISPYAYDVTEVDGLDNLYEAEGILKEGMERAKKCYGSDETFYLVNGSTCGIMTAIFATTKENDRILVARNCHGSVYKSIYLRKLIPEYVYPEIIAETGILGSINPQEIEKKLIEFDDIKAVVITSPTYEGIVSDIGQIAEIVHRYKKILIVDEAHGSHLGFHDYFPKSAVSYDADIVVQSMHKTMLGLTQTGLLHIKGNSVDPYEVRKYLGMFQTSSPSYVLMSSIDMNVCKLLESGAKLFENYVENLTKFKKNVENLTNISIFNVENYKNQGVFDTDKSKISIFIHSKYKDAKYLYNILRDRYKLQMEMVNTKYVLAITTLSDSEEGLLRLYKALEEVDREIRIDEIYFAKESDKRTNNELEQADSLLSATAIIKYAPSEIDNHKKEIIDIKDSVGKISCEYIYMYPPGIPILAPGEIITSDIVKKYVNYKDKGFNIYGPRYNEDDKIVVVKEDFKAWAGFFT